MLPKLTGPAHDGSGALEPDADHVSPVERMCNDIGERMMQMGQELDRQKKIIANLLFHVGKRDFCRGPNCKQEIAFILHRNGKMTPYNLDGTNHYISCPDRDLFHRRTNAR